MEKYLDESSDIPFWESIKTLSVYIQIGKIRFHKAINATQIICSMENSERFKKKIKQIKNWSLNRLMNLTDHREGNEMLWECEWVIYWKHILSVNVYVSGEGILCYCLSLNPVKKKIFFFSSNNNWFIVQAAWTQKRTFNYCFISLEKEGSTVLLKWLRVSVSVLPDQ